MRLMGELALCDFYFNLHKVKAKIDETHSFVVFINQLTLRITKEKVDTKRIRLAAAAATSVTAGCSENAVQNVLYSTWP